jgi:drug/metabolite transporter (DMT)-like permease
MVWLGLSALIGLAANQIFLFTGLKYTSATNASLIFSLSPLITAALAAVFLKEIITWRMVLGSVVAITGLFLVLELQGQFRLAFGDLMLFGAAFTFSCNLIFVRILSRRLSPLMITVYSFLLSALIFDPFSFAVADVKWNHSLTIWITAILSVIVAQGIASIMWNKGMSRVGAAKSAIVLNLQPLMTLLLDFLIFQRTITFQQIVGVTLVFLGVLLATLQKKRLPAANHPASG